MEFNKGDFRGLRALFTVAVSFLWVLLMVKAIQGETYRLPYLGDLAHVMSSKWNC